MPDEAKLEATVAYVVRLLAERDYIALEHLSCLARLTAAEMQKAIDEYRGTLLSAPFEASVVAPIRGAVPHAWAVTVDLHTVEEGRSDLTLELRLIENPGSMYGVELEDLRVM